MMASRWLYGDAISSVMYIILLTHNIHEFTASQKVFVELAKYNEGPSGVCW